MTVLKDLQIGLVKTDQDKTDLRALHVICFDPVEHLYLEFSLRDVDCFSVLARVKNKAVGYQVTYVNDKSAYSLWNGVTPSYRGNGLNYPIAEFAHIEARNRGAEIYGGCVAGNNAANLHANKKMGFEIMDSWPDSSIKDGKVIKFTNHYVQKSLMKETPGAQEEGGGSAPGVGAEENAREE